MDDDTKEVDFSASIGGRRPHVQTPSIPKAPEGSSRMSRKRFNGYLYDLYGCTRQNDVMPDYVYGASVDDETDYHLEVYLNAPGGGTMIAIHTGLTLDDIDVIRVPSGTSGSDCVAAD